MRARVLLAIAVTLQLNAQEQLSLREAVQLALKNNKSVEASGAFMDEARSQIREARAGLLPKLDYSESLTRSNDPVFVFGSLLGQHQFTQNNFDIYALNRPGFLDNFQSVVSARETLFDAGKTREAIKSAKLSQQVAATDDGETRTAATLSVIRAYLDAQLAKASLEANEKALESAQADLTQAEQVRQAGRSTDADVLSIRVHLAQVQEIQIRRDADLTTALAALDDALGMPLDTVYELSTPLSASKSAALNLRDLEQSALRARPEAMKAELKADLASTQIGAARSALWPTISIHGVFGDDRQQFANRTGANWLGSVALTWNLYNGGADTAKVEDAKQEFRRARAERDRMASAVQLEVRRAWQNLKAVKEQVSVAQSVIAAAEESLRITQNRYQAGMSTVTDLLRTEVAVLESRTEYLAALHDQRLAEALLDGAAGTLSENSEVVNE